MESLKTALDRLGKAVDRLEIAATAREVRAMRREQELSEELRQARLDEARAVQNAEAVSQRLAAAIGRLENVLEN
ncbi:hypothetical protein [Azospirillum sp. TSO22-1]|uniref:hypothetical protein n=1 Tax=Azospirillum sp. TSO22-1 TaxID=716789 RepID=UPI000D61F167|nr:hypothetical protein [Azospirillum sp. TSO22-1]PWC32162.1 hypothetical protein TSO221_31370 [Azospirillum sp. TSO22-1]